MKKIIAWCCCIALTVSLTGCKSSTNYENDVREKSTSTEIQENKQSEAVTADMQRMEQSENATESYKVVELTDFNVLLESIKNDPNVGSSKYQIYLEKVAVNDDSTTEKEEIIVASYIEKENSDGTVKIIEKAIAAPYNYLDPYRHDSKMELEAKKEWKYETEKERGAYTAESIIDSAMKYAGLKEEDFSKVYEKVVIASN